MHKPWHTLLFAVLLFAGLALLAVVFPADGLKLGSYLSLRFPSPSALLSEPKPVKDITAVLQAISRVDTTFRIDSPAESADSAKGKDEPLNLSLQYSNAAAMSAFYGSLASAVAQTIRVLHYGDSQIEADRISGYLRLKLQGEFGGSGSGLLSLMPLTSGLAHVVTASGNFERYAAFNAKDSRVKHNRYGVCAGFTRFVPYRRISDTTMPATATVQVHTTEKGGAAAAKYNRLRLFYGGSRTRTWCELYDGGELVAADSLEKGGVFQVKDFAVKTMDQVLRFRGLDSPDLYAMSLEGDEGVMVDNIPMRGSSGTFFHHLDREQMRTFYEFLNVRLIILQFGGNTLPALEDTSMARNYAAYIRNQISIVKKLAPKASILFVGPADMSVKEGTSYVTHPLLEPLRNHLRRQVLEAGCAFFDLYDVMGGRNSMPAWVDEHLAGSDYTHFTPKGAGKIATVLYSALMKDYKKHIGKLK